jgi:2'-5' RNA ligase
MFSPIAPLNSINRVKLQNLVLIKYGFDLEDFEYFEIGDFKGVVFRKKDSSIGFVNLEDTFQMNEMFFETVLFPGARSSKNINFEDFTIYRFFPEPTFSIKNIILYSNYYFKSNRGIPPQIADHIEVIGGEEKKDLHTTLLFIPNWIDLPQEQKIKAFSFFKKRCAEYPTLKGEISGIGCFNQPNSDVFYLSVDLPNLEKLQSDLSLVDLPYSKDHGFTPHITLKYLKKDEFLPYPKLPKAIPLKITHLTLVTKGIEKFNFPLLG